MKNSPKKGLLSSIYLLPILVFFHAGCDSAGNKGISQILPLILQGTGASVYTEPGNSVLTAPSSENPTLLTASSGTSSCNDAAVEPPASFGSAGPEAFYSVCSSENVNRFKNLEIKFSHPVNQSTFAASLSVMCNGSALPGPAPG
ncbi:MAG TPA: hypothetical protein PL048_10740, partial [Leptospiraceae bacterium]|nr:hypothetical protein [Leptospiraceae bacterium]